jgi:predicted metal-dependent hydrolase
VKTVDCPTDAAYSIQLDSRSIPLKFVRKWSAHRYVLRVLRDGTARVSIPRSGSIRYAVEFANKHRDWIDKQLVKTLPAWEQGTVILFRGAESAIQISEGSHNLHVQFGSLQFSAPRSADLRVVLQAHLRSLATPELVQRTLELAAEHSVSIKSVHVRNQHSRWGSCSTQGRISLNWRLIQTPEFVRDYIIIHELMHLHEMNHSPRFWKHVEAACPNFAEAERWLRKHSSLLT